MFVMYGTFHVPFSPGTRPKLTVPSASRGVGSCGPRPRPPPPCRAPPLGAGACAAPGCACCCASTQTVEANTAAAAAHTSAARTLLVTEELLGPARAGHYVVNPGCHLRAARSGGQGSRTPPLRGVALARRREQTLARRFENDRASVARRAAVLREASLDRHFVTDLHGVARPTLAH